MRFEASSASTAPHLILYCIFFPFFQFKNPLILLLLASALVSVITKEYEDAASIAMVRGTSPSPQPLALWSLCAHPVMPLCSQAVLIVVTVAFIQVC